MSELSIQAAAPAIPGRLRLFWRSFAENRGAVLGLGIMVVLIVVAALADVIAPHSPIEQFRSHFLTPPIWEAGGDPAFLLGTDDVGRDMLSRLIYGARLSLIIGFSVASLSLVAGTILGLTAAFAGGMVDIVIMRVMDILLVFPSLLLAIVIVAILGPGLFNAMLAVVVVTLPGYTRLARASALSELARDYVTATRCAGAGSLRLMFDTVLPNCLAPLIVQVSLGFATAILDAAALGFLGLGAQPPTPEWGTMLSGSLQYYQRAWWVLAFPGFAILLTVMAFNLFGDGLRDALDPKLKR
ncbi:ABC transporter permease subunit [Limobrevibacterium gyesilva]|uniref:ABC transporter permease subunit n=1 Tax=Limobrevibacterium gyesilva TaxID=2991712 RepID=A0AA42CHY2_9PROT|nr:ABC transporter permease subunit [Limobrevibacterium gyesilva]MCW3475340.1 ABC transporter permease subunit [Limobrevibacterium gyesilva]